MKKIGLIVCVVLYSTLQSHESKIIGLMPIRNEGYLLGQSLRALAQFTDEIIILDDASDDDTPEIIRSLSQECNVTKVITKKQWYRDEPGDRNALLEAGRNRGGTHFIVIDADEMFTSNFLKKSKLKRKILKLQPGESLYFAWIQLWRSTAAYRFDDSIWTNNYKPFIFCDDKKCSYQSNFIHTTRVPGNLSGKSYTKSGYTYGVLHFQFVNWRNLLIKHAWYRCLEHIRDPKKSITTINALYGASIDESGLRTKNAPSDWFSYYPFFDKTIFDQPEKWREKQIMQWFNEYGKKFFKKLEIWDIDWQS